MEWELRVRAILATAVVVCVPLASLDVLASQNSPVTWLVTVHPIPALTAVLLSFVFSVKLADWLMDADFTTRGPASLLSLAAIAAHVGAVLLVLNKLQR